MGKMMLITLYHLNESRSERIICLLEALGIEYKVEAFQRDAETMLAPLAYKNLHPLGKAPIVSIGDETLTETGYIMERILRDFGQGRLVPEAGSEDYEAYRYWMHACEGSVMPYLIIYFVLRQTTKPPVPFFIRPFTKLVFKGACDGYLGETIDGILKFMDDTLANSTWFAGDEFTAADIMMSFAVKVARDEYGIEKFANLQRFLKAMEAQACYQATIQKMAEV